MKTRPRTEDVGCRNHPVCFASLPQYCCIQQAGNGFVSPHCVCSVYQKQITVFLVFLPFSVFCFFLKACMHVIAQSTFIDQTDASVCLLFLFHQGTMLPRPFTRCFTSLHEWIAWSHLYAHANFSHSYTKGKQIDLAACT